MEYSDIRRIMVAKGLAADPAFQTVNFSIQPIPSFDGCPLGLYFPDVEYVSQFGATIPAMTIILPPDGTQGALLHELGHHYGNYYHNDLSENFAENFRQKYQSGMALLYRRYGLEQLADAGRLFREGEKGVIEVAFLRPLAGEHVAELSRQLYYAGDGEVLPKVTYRTDDIPTIRILFRKGADWPVIVASVLAGSAIATVGVLGYAVYKLSKEMPWVIPVSLFGTGLFFLFRNIYKEAKRVKV